MIFLCIIPATNADQIYRDVIEQTKNSLVAASRIHQSFPKLSLEYP